MRACVRACMCVGKRAAMCGCVWRGVYEYVCVLLACVCVGARILG